MLEALGRINVKHQEVSKVLIATNPRWMHVCNQLEPRTGLEAKFSYRLTAAMALARRNTGALDTFCDAACADPTLLALSSRVEVVFSDAIAETASRVEVLDRGGSMHVAEADLASALEPRERKAKILAKASALITSDKAQVLWAALSAEAKAPKTVSVIAAMLRAA